jgi:hypothetical protein
MTLTQHHAILRNVEAVGYFKTSQYMQRMYEDGIINYADLRAAFRTLRNHQQRDNGRVSDFLIDTLH